MTIQLQPYYTNENPNTTLPGNLQLLLLDQASEMLLTQYTLNYMFMFQKIGPLEKTLN